MQVLGDLVKLANNNDLPLPWWHRAPLGLQSETWCYVAIVESENRPAPDLIISVLNPSNWDKMMRVRCIHHDTPGAVSKVIDLVEDFNIALAESVTLQAGEFHDITLVCEPKSNDRRLPTEAQIKEKLHDIGFLDITVSGFKPRKLLWIRRGKVGGGWIKNVEWRSEIESRYAEVDNFDMIDLSRAVISADTTYRMVRLVFPYKNAKSIRVEHLDEPGVLKTLTEVLLKYDINVLSKLLRRGGASPGNAILLAACEPKGGGSREALYSEAIAELNSLPARLMIETSARDGIEARQTITPREPDTIVARIPSNLVGKVRSVESFVPRHKMPVFFSHRFVKENRPEMIAKTVRDSIDKNDCHLLEASPEDYVTGPNLIFSEVSAKMWAAKAGIILVTGLQEDDSLGKNLPHEYGFLQGQAKPLLLLCEDKLDSLKSLWTNIDGVYAPRFPSDEVAFLEKKEGSLHNIISKWIKRVCQAQNIS